MRRYLITFLIALIAVIGNDCAHAQIKNNGAIGSVTIDGKIWNQLAMRPLVPLGKFAVAFDLVVYFDAEGNVRSEGWDFSSSKSIKNSIIDKIYYIKYGDPGSSTYARIGALDNIDIGYGVLVNGYSNSVLYPQDRKIGVIIEKNNQSFKFKGFVNDLKENAGLYGGRIQNKNILGFPIGITFVSDRNQYLGLKDSDNDGRPNIVDDFPYNGKWWLDTDGDGLSDYDPNEWDIDGDGITDTLDSRIPGYIGDPFILDGNITRKDEPINLSEDSDGIMALAIDIGLPLIKSDNYAISIYSQAAQMIGRAINPETKKIQNLGVGIIPLGIASQFGLLKFKLEYRIIPDGNFEFDYWNRLYEIERISFVRNNSNQVLLRTKESRLGRYGRQKGYFSGATVNFGGILQGNLSYNNMTGNLWSETDSRFTETKNQTFISSLSLKKGFSKLKRASVFYQQRNVPNPFRFEYSESTIIGYNLGISMGQGLVLNYIFRRSFRDYNANGRIDGINETIDITSIETSFIF
jgi:hypothetical protein